jgi:hypothetical protein
MAIEVFTILPEQDGQEPTIAEIAIPLEEMPEALRFLDAAHLVEGMTAAGVDRHEFEEPRTTEERTESALRTGILLDVRHDIRFSLRDKEPVIRLTAGEPFVRGIIFDGLIRGIELVTKTRSADKELIARAEKHRHDTVVKHIAHRMMSAAEYELAVMSRTPEA